MSFYSHRPEVHDLVTGTPGSQRRTLAAIERVLRRGSELRLSLISTADNRGDIAGAIDLLESVGVARNQMGLDEERSVGRGAFADGAAEVPHALLPPEVPSAHGAAVRGWQALRLLSRRSASLHFCKKREPGVDSPHLFARPARHANLACRGAQHRLELAPARGATHLRGTAASTSRCSGVWLLQRRHEPIERGRHETPSAPAIGGRKAEDWSRGVQGGLGAQVGVHDASCARAFTVTVVTMAGSTQAACFKSLRRAMASPDANSGSGGSLGRDTSARIHRERQIC